MAKSNKIEVKNVLLSVNQDNIYKIKGFEDEEVPFEDFSEKLDNFIKMGKPINIKISPTRKSNGVVRKPTYKYICPSCAKEVKSNVENMTIKCVECDTDFIQE
jgi:hypothetical protein